MLVKRTFRSITQRLVKQLQLLSHIELFIDENYSTLGFISFIANKDKFLENVKSCDEKFSKYNLSKPKFLTKLEDKIISFSIFGTKSL